MTGFSEKARSIFRDLGQDWQRKSASAQDIELLDQLVNHSDMQPVWEKLEETWSGTDPETDARLLALTVFRLRQGPDAWQSRTDAERKAAIDQIERTAKKLVTLVKGAPIDILGSEAIRKLGLVAPEVRILQSGNSDFVIVLEDLINQANDVRSTRPILRRPNRPLASRRVFVVQLDRHLRRRFRRHLHSAVATIAALALDDPAIDGEVVRKILDHTDRG